MSIQLNVKADLKEVRRLFKELGPGVDRAAARALNKTVTSVRAQVARDVQKKRNLKISIIKQSLKMIRANYRRLSAAIEASGRSIPIRHFGANPTKRGVTVRIAKGGKRTLLKRQGRGSFINPGSRLGPNVFVRTTSKRLPIKKWAPVPGISSVFLQPKIVRAMRALADKTWVKRFREEVRNELLKAERKART